MKLYGIACQGEFPRAELLVAARKIAATELTKFEPNDFYLGFIGAHDGRMLRLFLSISGETRTSFSIEYFFPEANTCLIQAARSTRAANIPTPIPTECSHCPAIFT